MNRQERQEAEADAEKVFDLQRRLAQSQLKNAEALERARAVGVLDAWANGTRYWAMESPGVCHLRVNLNGRWSSLRMFGGGRGAVDNDAARAAAAKAIESGEV